tara:strand:- start:234 stop:464 length:231 start_codon:yes stop_codon:yes gene_type:complete
MKVNLEQLEKVQKELFRQQCDLDIQKAMVKHFIKKKEDKLLNLTDVVVPFVCDKHPNANTYTSTMGKVCCVKCVMG